MMMIRDDDDDDEVRTMRRRWWGIGMPMEMALSPTMVSVKY